MAESSPSRPRAERGSPAASWRRQVSPMSDPAGEVSDFLLDTRNSPEAQRKKYADAQREHQRLLSAALHVFELHELAEAQREIEEEEKRRQQRVAEEAKRIEKERQAKIRQLEDEARLAAQKAAPIPVPKPPVISPPAPQQEPPKPKPPPQPQPQAEETPAVKPPAQDGAKSAESRTNGAPASPFGVPSQAQPQPKPPSSPSSFLLPKQPPKPQQDSLKPFSSASNGLPLAQQTNGAPAATAPATAPAVQAPAAINRHIEVHKNLKELRKFVAEQAKTNPALKSRMGDMRRDIRKSFGQLTSGGPKENRIPVNRIVSTLTAGLKEVPSELIDPSRFVLEPRPNPVDGALHNEPQLPSLYLYLLNILSKAAIAQFVNESGADPRTAEAIGQAVAKVYSEAEFLWRGQPMIDMLIAKFAVVCPVLFGGRGNDKTERGRAAVGWRKEDGRWIAEQYHVDRMTGLGAGFAAITLRDFSRAKGRTSPWPPTVYWTALARIVDTPPDQMSETQCYVLKAMIDGNEGKLLGFYGNAGVAALRCALVDYPARIPKSSAASETLKVLAKTINVRTGLDLEQI